MKHAQENKTRQCPSSLVTILRTLALLCSCLLCVASTPAFAATHNTPAAQTQAGPCTVQSFGGNIGEEGMWGSGDAQCTEAVEVIDIQLVALSCQPLLWGCLWVEQGPIGSGCTYTPTVAQHDYFCPQATIGQSQAYEWYSSSIATGKLYGVRVEGAVSTNGTWFTSATDHEVQF